MEAKKSLRQDYEIVIRHGKPVSFNFGAYGSVQLGRCRLTKKLVAIKKIQGKLAFSQIQFHHRLNHPNIIRMYDFYFQQTTTTTFIVLEYAGNGTLFEYIQRNRKDRVKDKGALKTIFIKACTAIDYLHSVGIIHPDIKPEDMLLDRNNNIKICDFGYAGNCESRLTLCRTVQYMSPEMIMRKPYNYKVDIWGLGILLFELIQGHVPFQGQFLSQVLQKMTKPIYFSKRFNKKQIDLVHKILKVNPKDRPEITQILASPCFHSENSGSKQKSKRSTMQQDPENNLKIQILNVKNLLYKDQTYQRHSDPLEKRPAQENIQLSSPRNKKIQIMEIKNFQDAEKSPKKESGKIEIISIRDLGINMDQTINFSGIDPRGKKISLRKIIQRS